MSNVIVDKNKIDILANAISDKSGVPVTMTLDEMVEAVDGIETGGDEPNLQAKTYTVDSAGTATVTADSGYDGLSEVEVSVPQAAPYVYYGNQYVTQNNSRKWQVRGICDIDNEVKDHSGYIGLGTYSGNWYTYNAVPANTSVTPTESAQTIGGANYMMEGAVTVNAIPSNYVGSGITRRDSTDLTASGATVTVPSGYYSAQASKAVASGTAGTPTATKGTVSNHSISVTPSVTNTTGYITGSTKTGTAVTVSASELVSGTYTVDSSGTKDVTNYASASVPSADIYPWYDSDFTTQNGVLKFNIEAGYGVNSGGWVSSGDVDIIMLDAVPSNTTITPSTSSQTIGGVRYVMQGPITVSAMPTMTLPTSAAASATSGYTSKATISRSTSDQYINIAPGYNSAGGYYKISAVANGSATAPATISGTSATLTTGTGTLTLTKTVSVTPSVTAGYVSSGTAGNSSVSLTASVTIDPTPTASGATVTIPAGYYTAQTTKSVTSGSATGPSSLSGTSATVSTGTNTLTLTKTGVTTTPTVSAGYVSSATSSTATVALTASITTKAATTYMPTTSNQTIASGTYLTGTQTISGDANLIAGNIKKNVSIFGVTGSYDGSGGSGESGTFVDYSTSVTSMTSTSITFGSVMGQPTSFAILSKSNIATSSTPTLAVIVYDGTSVIGQTITNTSNAQVSYVSSGLSQSYSGGSLTVTSTGTARFDELSYYLVYSYGSSNNIYTSDVQVGSGATSITFTGLEDEPLYFSCIFKSNFSTSSGYQRVIAVVEDGGDTFGLEMDSSAKYSDSHWSYTYNNGSLTITSQGTNAGGYFHQPGYYQLTYATEGESGNYQSKTVYATSSQQVVQADSGYDALKKITIPAVTTTNLSASNILSGVTIQVGDAADSDRIASVTGNVVLQNYYTGSSAPSSSTGSNGDLYLQS